MSISVHYCVSVFYSDIWTIISKAILTSLFSAAGEGGCTTCWYTLTDTSCTGPSEPVGSPCRGASYFPSGQAFCLHCFWWIHNHSGVSDVLSMLCFITEFIFKACS